jgi:hypothetical protein
MIAAAILLLVASLAVGAVGGLMIMAGAMSDAPTEGEHTAKVGCSLIVAAVAGIIGSGLMLL